MTVPDAHRPAAWAVLEQALAAKTPVRARYHGHERVLSPHALGWRHGRAKLLCYQSCGTTNDGALPADPRQRWRSMSVDEIEDAEVIDGPWSTATNWSHNFNGIDHVEVALEP